MISAFPSELFFGDVNVNGLPSYCVLRLRNFESCTVTVSFAFSAPAVHFQKRNENYALLCRSGVSSLYDLYDSDFDHVGLVDSVEIDAFAETDVVAWFRADCSQFSHALVHNNTVPVYGVVRLVAAYASAIEDGLLDQGVGRNADVIATVDLSSTVHKSVASSRSETVHIAFRAAVFASVLTASQTDFQLFMSANRTLIRGFSLINNSCKPISFVIRRQSMPITGLDLDVYLEERFEEPMIGHRLILDSFSSMCFSMIVRTGTLRATREHYQAVLQCDNLLDDRNSIALTLNVSLTKETQCSFVSVTDLNVDFGNVYRGSRVRFNLHITNHDSREDVQIKVTSVQQALCEGEVALIMLRDRASDDTGDEGHSALVDSVRAPSSGGELGRAACCGGMEDKSCDKLEGRRDEEEAPVVLAAGKRSDCVALEYAPFPDSQISEPSTVKFEVELCASSVTSDRQQRIVLRCKAALFTSSIVVSPTHLDFGECAVGQSKRCSFVITNIAPLPGRFSIHIRSKIISIEGGNAPLLNGSTQRRETWQEFALAPLATLPVVLIIAPQRVNAHYCKQMTVTNTSSSTEERHIVTLKSANIAPPEADMHNEMYTWRRLGICAGIAGLLDHGQGSALTATAQVSCSHCSQEACEYSSLAEAAGPTSNACKAAPAVHDNTMQRIRERMGPADIVVLSSDASGKNTECSHGVASVDSADSDMPYAIANVPIIVPYEVVSHVQHAITLHVESTSPEVEVFYLDSEQLSTSQHLLALSNQLVACYMSGSIRDVGGDSGGSNAMAQPALLATSPQGYEGLGASELSSVDRSSGLDSNDVNGVVTDKDGFQASTEQTCSGRVISIRQELLRLLSTAAVMTSAIPLPPGATVIAYVLIIRTAFSTEWVTKEDGLTITVQGLETPRFVRLSYKLCSSLFNLNGQRTKNFGEVNIGERKTTRLFIVNRCESMLFLKVSKSRSVTAGHLRIECSPAQSIVLPVRPYATKEVEVTFLAGIKGGFEESLRLVNVLDPTNNTTVTLKANVVKADTFEVIPDSWSFGDVVVPTTLSSLPTQHNMNERVAEDEGTENVESSKCGVEALGADDRDMRSEKLTTTDDDTNAAGCISTEVSKQHTDQLHRHGSYYSTNCGDQIHAVEQQVAPHDAQVSARFTVSNTSSIQQQIVVRLSAHLGKYDDVIEKHTITAPTNTETSVNAACLLSSSAGAGATPDKSAACSIASFLALKGLSLSAQVKMHLAGPSSGSFRKIEEEIEHLEHKMKIYRRKNKTEKLEGALKRIKVLKSALLGETIPTQPRCVLPDKSGSTMTPSSPVKTDTTTCEIATKLGADANATSVTPTVDEGSLRRGENAITDSVTVESVATDRKASPLTDDQSPDTTKTQNTQSDAIDATTGNGSSRAWDDCPTGGRNTPDSLVDAAKTTKSIEASTEATLIQSPVRHVELLPPDAVAKALLTDGLFLPVMTAGESVTIMLSLTCSRVHDSTLPQKQSCTFYLIFSEACDHESSRVIPVHIVLLRHAQDAGLPLTQLSHETRLCDGQQQQQGRLCAVTPHENMRNAELSCAHQNHLADCTVRGICNIKSDESATATQHTRSAALTNTNSVTVLKHKTKRPLSHHVHCAECTPSDLARDSSNTEQQESQKTSSSDAIHTDAMPSSSLHSSHERQTNVSALVTSPPRCITDPHNKLLAVTLVTSTTSRSMTSNFMGCPFLILHNTVVHDRVEFVLRVRSSKATALTMLHPQRCGGMNHTFTPDSTAIVCQQHEPYRRTSLDAQFVFHPCIATVSADETLDIAVHCTPMSIGPQKYFLGIQSTRAPADTSYVVIELNPTLESELISVEPRQLVFRDILIPVATKRSTAFVATTPSSTSTLHSPSPLSLSSSATNQTALLTHMSVNRDKEKDRADTTQAPAPLLASSAHKTHLLTLRTKLPLHYILIIRSNVPSQVRLYHDAQCTLPVQQPLRRSAVREAVRVYVQFHASPRSSAQARQVKAGIIVEAAALGCEDQLSALPSPHQAEEYDVKEKYASIQQRESIGYNNYTSTKCRSTCHYTDGLLSGCDKADYTCSSGPQNDHCASLTEEDKDEADGAEERQSPASFTTAQANTSLAYIDADSLHVVSRLVVQVRVRVGSGALQLYPHRNGTVTLPTIGPHLALTRTSVTIVNSSRAFAIAAALVSSSAYVRLGCECHGQTTSQRNNEVHDRAPGQLDNYKQDSVSYLGVVGLAACTSKRDAAACYKSDMMATCAESDRDDLDELHKLHTGESDDTPPGLCPSSRSAMLVLRAKNYRGYSHRMSKRNDDNKGRNVENHTANKLPLALSNASAIPGIDLHHCACTTCAPDKSDEAALYLTLQPLEKLVVSVTLLLPQPGLMKETLTLINRSCAQPPQHLALSALRSDRSVAVHIPRTLPDCLHSSRSSSSDTQTCADDMKNEDSNDNRSCTIPNMCYHSRSHNQEKKLSLGRRRRICMTDKPTYTNDAFEVSLSNETLYLPVTAIMRTRSKGFRLSEQENEGLMHFHRRLSRKKVGEAGRNGRSEDINHPLCAENVFDLDAHSNSVSCSGMHANTCTDLPDADNRHDPSNVSNRSIRQSVSKAADEDGHAARDAHALLHVCCNSEFVKCTDLFRGDTTASAPPPDGSKSSPSSVLSLLCSNPDKLMSADTKAGQTNDVVAPDRSCEVSPYARNHTRFRQNTIPDSVKGCFVLHNHCDAFDLVTEMRCEGLPLHFHVVDCMRVASHVPYTESDGEDSALHNHDHHTCSCSSSSSAIEKETHSLHHHRQLNHTQAHLTGGAISTHSLPIHGAFCDYDKLEEEPLGNYDMLPVPINDTAVQTLASFGRSCGHVCIPARCTVLVHVRVVDTPELLVRDAENVKRLTSGSQECVSLTAVVYACVVEVIPARHAWMHASGDVSSKDSAVEENGARGAAEYAKNYLSSSMASVVRCVCASHEICKRSFEQVHNDGNSSSAPALHINRLYSLSDIYPMLALSSYWRRPPTHTAPPIGQCVLRLHVHAPFAASCLSIDSTHINLGLITRNMLSVRNHALTEHQAHHSHSLLTASLEFNHSSVDDIQHSKGSRRDTRAYKHRDHDRLDVLLPVTLRNRSLHASLLLRTMSTSSALRIDHSNYSNMHCVRYVPCQPRRQSHSLKIQLSAQDECQLHARLCLHDLPQLGAFKQKLCFLPMCDSCASHVCLCVEGVYYDRLFSVSVLLARSNIKQCVKRISSDDLSMTNCIDDSISEANVRQSVATAIATPRSHRPLCRSAECDWLEQRVYENTLCLPTPLRLTSHRMTSQADQTTQAQGFANSLLLHELLFVCRALHITLHMNVSFEANPALREMVRFRLCEDGDADNKDGAACTRGMSAADDENDAHAEAKAGATVPSSPIAMHLIPSVRNRRYSRHLHRRNGLMKSRDASKDGGHYKNEDKDARMYNSARNKESMQRQEASNSCSSSGDEHIAEACCTESNEHTRARSFRPDSCSAIDVSPSRTDSSMAGVHSLSSSIVSTQPFPSSSIVHYDLPNLSSDQAQAQHTKHRRVSRGPICHADVADGSNGKQGGDNGTAQRLRFLCTLRNTCDIDDLVSAFLHPSSASSQVTRSRANHVDEQHVERGGERNRAHAAEMHTHVNQDICKNAAEVHGLVSHGNSCLCKRTLREKIIALEQHVQQRWTGSSSCNSKSGSRNKSYSYTTWPNPCKNISSRRQGQAAERTLGCMVTIPIVTTAPLWLGDMIFANADTPKETVSVFGRLERPHTFHTSHATLMLQPLQVGVAAQSCDDTAALPYSKVKRRRRRTRGARRSRNHQAFVSYPEIVFAGEFTVTNSYGGRCLGLCVQPIFDDLLNDSCVEVKVMSRIQLLGCTPLQDGELVNTCNTNSFDASATSPAIYNDANQKQVSNTSAQSQLSNVCVKAAAQNDGTSHSASVSPLAHWHTRTSAAAASTHSNRVKSRDKNDHADTDNSSTDDNITCTRLLVHTTTDSSEKVDNRCRISDTACQSGPLKFAQADAVLGAGSSTCTDMFNCTTWTNSNGCSTVHESLSTSGASEFHNARSKCHSDGIVTESDLHHSLHTASSFAALDKPPNGAQLARPRCRCTAGDAVHTIHLTHSESATVRVLVRCSVAHQHNMTSARDAFTQSTSHLLLPNLLSCSAPGISHRTSGATQKSSAARARRRNHIPCKSDDEESVVPFALLLMDEKLPASYQVIYLNVAGTQPSEKGVHTSAEHVKESADHVRLDRNAMCVQHINDLPDSNPLVWVRNLCALRSVAAARTKTTPPTLVDTVAVGTGSSCVNTSSREESPPPLTGAIQPVDVDEAVRAATTATTTTTDECNEVAHPLPTTDALAEATRGVTHREEISEAESHTDPSSADIVVDTNGTRKGTIDLANRAYEKTSSLLFGRTKLLSCQAHLHEVSISLKEQTDHMASKSFAHRVDCMHSSENAPSEEENDTTADALARSKKTQHSTDVMIEPVKTAASTLHDITHVDVRAEMSATDTMAASLQESATVISNTLSPPPCASYDEQHLVDTIAITNTIADVDSASHAHTEDGSAANMGAAAMRTKTTKSSSKDTVLRLLNCTPVMNTRGAYITSYVFARDEIPETDLILYHDGHTADHEATSQDDNLAGQTNSSQSHKQEAMQQQQLKATKDETYTSTMDSSNNPIAVPRKHTCKENVSYSLVVTAQTPLPWLVIPASEGTLLPHEQRALRVHMLCGSEVGFYTAYVHIRNSRRPSEVLMLHLTAEVYTNDTGEALFDIVATDGSRVLSNTVRTVDVGTLYGEGATRAYVGLEIANRGRVPLEFPVSVVKPFRVESYVVPLSEYVSVASAPYACAYHKYDCEAEENMHYRCAREKDESATHHNCVDVPKNNNMDRGMEVGNEFEAARQAEKSRAEGAMSVAKPARVSGEDGEKMYASNFQAKITSSCDTTASDDVCMQIPSRDTTVSTSKNGGVAFHTLNSFDEPRDRLPVQQAPRVGCSDAMLSATTCSSSSLFKQRPLFEGRLIVCHPHDVLSQTGQKHVIVDPHSRVRLVFVLRCDAICLHDAAQERFAKFHYTNGNGTKRMACGNEPVCDHESMRAYGKEVLKSDERTESTNIRDTNNNNNSNSHRYLDNDNHRAECYYSQTRRDRPSGVDGQTSFTNLEGSPHTHSISETRRHNHQVRATQGLHTHVDTSATDQCTGVRGEADVIFTCKQAREAIFTFKVLFKILPCTFATPPTYEVRLCRSLHTRNDMHRANMYRHEDNAHGNDKHGLSSNDAIDDDILSSANTAVGTADASQRISNTKQEVRHLASLNCLTGNHAKMRASASASARTYAKDEECPMTGESAVSTMPVHVRVYNFLNKTQTFLARTQSPVLSIWAHNDRTRCRADNSEVKRCQHDENVYVDNSSSKNEDMQCTVEAVDGQAAYGKHTAPLSGDVEMRKDGEELLDNVHADHACSDDADANADICNRNWTVGNASEHDKRQLCRSSLGPQHRIRNTHDEQQQQDVRPYIQGQKYNNLLLFHSAKEHICLHVPPGCFGVFVVHLDLLRAAALLNWDTAHAAQLTLCEHLVILNYANPHEHARVSLVYSGETRYHSVHSRYALLDAPFAPSPSHASYSDDANVRIAAADMHLSLDSIRYHYFVSQGYAEVMLSASRLRMFSGQCVTEFYVMQVARRLTSTFVRITATARRVMRWHHGKHELDHDTTSPRSAEDGRSALGSRAATRLRGQSSTSAVRHEHIVRMWPSRENVYANSHLSATQARDTTCHSHASSTTMSCVPAERAAHAGTMSTGMHEHTHMSTHGYAQHTNNDSSNSSNNYHDSDADEKDNRVLQSSHNTIDRSRPDIDAVKTQKYSGYATIHEKDCNAQSISQYATSRELRHCSGVTITPGRNFHDASSSSSDYDEDGNAYGENDNNSSVRPCAARDETCPHELNSLPAVSWARLHDCLLELSWIVEELLYYTILLRNSRVMHGYCVFLAATVTHSDLIRTWWTYRDSVAHIPEFDVFRHFVEIVDKLPCVTPSSATTAQLKPGTMKSN